MTVFTPARAMTRPSDRPFPGYQANIPDFDQPPRETPVALAVVIGVVVGLISFKVGMVLRARCTPSELSGDWWTAFERDFRVYGARLCDSPSSRGRHRRSI
jgi:hypothetical protein